MEAFITFPLSVFILRKAVSSHLLLQFSLPPYALSYFRSHFSAPLRHHLCSMPGRSIWSHKSVHLLLTPGFPHVPQPHGSSRGLSVFTCTSSGDSSFSMHTHPGLVSFSCQFDTNLKIPGAKEPQLEDCLNQTSQWLSELLFPLCSFFSSSICVLPI